MQDFSSAFQVSLAALHREWDRRVYSMRQLNPSREDLPKRPDTIERGTAALLLAGTPGSDYSAIRSALELGNTAVVDAFTPATAANLLGRSKFEAVVIAGRDGPGDYRPLIAALRSHPNLKGLPVLVTLESASLAVLQTELDALGVTVAPLSAPAGDLRRWVEGAVLHEQMTRALAKDFIRPADGTAGDVPGVFSNKFARTHLETLLASPHAALTSLAQLEFAFSIAPGGRPDVLDDCRTAAAGQLALLLPGSVMVSDAPGNAFWLVFPETGRPAADGILNQVTQALRATPLIPGESETPVDLFPHFRTRMAWPGENVPAFVSRFRTTRPDPSETVHH